MKEELLHPWKLRYVVLTDKQSLIYYKEKETEKVIKGKIQLVDFKAERYEEDPTNGTCRGFYFKLTPNEVGKRVSIRIKRYFFCAFTDTEMRSWVSSIQQSIQGSLINKNTIELEEALRTTVYTIPEEEIEIESELLGKGGSGCVKKGKWLGLIVAIKSISDMANAVDVHDLASFYQEIKLMR